MQLTNVSSQKPLKIEKFKGFYECLMNYDVMKRAGQNHKNTFNGRVFVFSPDQSPKKADPQKATENNGAAKKGAPEKEILKRDTTPQKSVNGKPATPGSVTPVMSNSKADQIQKTRQATLTPTTKPLVPPSASTVTTTSANQSDSGAYKGPGAGKGMKETEGRSTSSEKQRTSSIGDTWEQHKVCTL